MNAPAQPTRTPGPARPTRQKASRQRRLWQLVVLLGATLACLLAGIVWLVLRPDAPLSAIPDTAEIRSVRIERAGNRPIVLARQGQGWQIIEPVNMPGNPSRIEPLLSLAHAGAPGYDPDELDMAETGLDNPIARVQFGTVNVELGGVDVGGERRYIRREGRIALVPGWFASLLQGGIDAFADLRVFPDGLEQLEQVHDDNRSGTLDTRIWALLSARELVLADAVPSSTHDAPMNRVTLRAHVPSGAQREFELRWQADQAWLLPEGAGFAYALQTSSIPGIDPVAQQ